MKEEGEEAEDEEEEKGRRRSCIHTQESNHLQKATFPAAEARAHS